MKLSFFGAAGEVTGACTMLEEKNLKILVDCGMFQGSHFNEDKNHEPLPFDPRAITDVIVTHAHLDHVGRLPLLIKGGYEGRFYATPATAELARLIMEDAVEIMRENNRRYGTPILYGLGEVTEAVTRFQAVDYHEEFSLRPDVKSGRKKANVTVRFYDAGHIFGSVFAEINIGGKKVVFSGDIGNVGAPILRDTENLPSKTDALICESTYGDRLHESPLKRLAILEKIVGASMDKGGVLMIPAFSLERTQELLYDLNDLLEHRKQFPRVPIFLDSPLAIHATAVYKKYPAYYDTAATRLYKEGVDFFNFPGLVVTLTKEESKKINHTPGPKIIIAGSGMMNGGRIQHHAMRYLSDKNNTLLIIGFQAQGTLGRQILDGASSVKIYGETIPVRCYVKAVGALSAHGDQEKLLDWIKSGGELPKKIFFNHGEPQASGALVDKLRIENNKDSTAVTPGFMVEI